VLAALGTGKNRAEKRAAHPAVKPLPPAPASGGELTCMRAIGASFPRRGSLIAVKEEFAGC